MKKSTVPIKQVEADEVKDNDEAVSDESLSSFFTPQPRKEKKDSEETARLNELKLEQPVKEENNLSASLIETTSRSGRRRKPSRFV